MIITKFEELSIPVNEIYKNLNYRNIELQNKVNEIINKKKLIHNFDEDIDDFILYSINYYDNLNNFIIFGYDKQKGYEYYLNNFKNDYSLYGIKHIKINSNLITKIMYQLLFSRMIIKNKHELNNYIEEKYNFLHKYDKEFIDITILIVCKKDLKKKYPLNDIIKNDCVIYIPNTKESIWVCASIFFSNSSLSFLEKQNFDYFFTKDMETSKKMFLKYRSWLNINIDFKHQMQFMLFSSIVLYLLGHRLMNDLDLYIHTIPDNIIEMTNEFKTNESFNYIEYKIKNTDNWPDHWNTWLDEWAVKCGAKYFEEILGNPKYHFYFLGVKIISLDCDIVRRVERNRPRAIADLIALRKRYSYNIHIPEIPKKIIKYIHIKDKTKEEIQNLIKNGGIFNEQNKEITIEIDNNIDKFINTIIYILNLRYRMTFTETEIKRELNMYINENPKKIIIKKIIIKK
jgi:hypothetical protein